jgi:hypothetical protein
MISIWHLYSIRAKLAPLKGVSILVRTFKIREFICILAGLVVVLFLVFLITGTGTARADDRNNGHPSWQHSQKGNDYYPSQPNSETISPWSNLNHYNDVTYVNSNVATEGSDIWVRERGLWTKITSNYSHGVQVSGDRLVIVNTAGQLVARDGLVDGEWIIERDKGDFDKFVLSPSFLVVKNGSYIYSKDDLDYNYWDILAIDAKDMNVVGDTVYYTPISPPHSHYNHPSNGGHRHPR